MRDFKMNRRQFGLGLAATSLALPMLGRAASAAGSTTVATFPNAWEQAYRKVITPMVAAKGFDLTRAPLQRMTVLRLADGRHQLIWTHHHLLMDGWSTARQIEETFA